MSSSTFKVLFGAAWLAILGGVMLAGAAHARVGFGLFVLAGVILGFLGSSLALNAGELSDRMVGEAERWSASPGRPLSVSRFGGLAMLAVGLGAVVVGLVGLLH